MRRGTVVLALGNPLRGDDGAGGAVLDGLRRAPDLPAEIDLLEAGTPGLGIALLLQGYRRALIVDAAELGRPPGEWLRFSDWERMLGGSELGGTLHNAGLAEALALGKALSILPPELVIYAIQPGQVDYQPGLSSPVQAALPGLIQTILSDLVSQNPPGRGDTHGENTDYR